MTLEPFGADGPAAARRAEQHRARFQRLLGADVSESRGWIRVVHPRLRGPLFNYLVPLSPPDPRAVDQELAGLLRQDRLPCLFLTPAAGEWQPPGLALREEQAVLGLDLRPAPAPGSGPAPQPGPQPRVWPLPPAAAGDWAALLLAALGVPPELQPNLRAAYAGMPERLAPGETLRLYLAEVEGRPAGTGLLYVDAKGWAGLYGAAVVEPYRGRGIGQALTQRRLADARRLGARAALVQTAPASPIAAIWRRVGAVTLYTAALFY